MQFTLTTRKAQKVRNAFNVNLPLEWVRHHKIVQGKVLNLNVDEAGRLIVEPADEVFA